jgi:hypothetical protein
MLKSVHKSIDYSLFYVNDAKEIITNEMSTNIIHKLEDISLISFFSTLPPAKVRSEHNLTQEQNWQWEQEKIKWKIIGSRIDYLQKIQAGLIVKDPFSDPGFDLAYRDLFDVVTNRLFAELNLMIAGWEEIRDIALTNQRNFSFISPRELFAERCKQQAESLAKNFISNDISRYETLQSIRGNYRYVNKFYRNNLQESEHNKMLKTYSESDSWGRFAIYAVWDYRHNKKFNGGKISRAWINFLEAFKQESKFACKKNDLKKYGVKINTIKWCQGKPVYTSTNQPAGFPVS